MIAEALQAGTGTVYSVGVYLAAVTVIGLAVTFFLKERQGVPLSDVEIGEKDEQAVVTA
ncbi:hypothetical protein ACH4E5_35560 [Streptomyces afghaniensis]|uniref:hypothetical protein n=1 Tax=Streptomyces afghaniensis TaxID=66865 RepID=UPI00379E9A1C